MMLPNQISSQRFTSIGKGGYRAAEVDAFVQKVYQNYNKLFNDNNILKERLGSITPLIDEYNENKRGIANALIWAQTNAEKVLNDARNEAKAIIEEAVAQGDKIVADKTAEAETAYSEKIEEASRNLEKAKKELELIKRESVTLSEKYISEVNAKANEIIEDANTKASKIVADAYDDAKSAREKADAILNEAKSELNELRKQAAKLKKEIELAVTTATDAFDSIQIGDFEVELGEENKLEALSIKKDEIEEFSIEFHEDAFDEPEEKAPVEEGVKGSKAFGIHVETVVDETIEEKEETQDNDFISGTVSTEMPDVNAYISKIFDTAGSGDGDYSSFGDELNDLFVMSLDNDVNNDGSNDTSDKEDSDIED